VGMRALLIELLARTGRIRAMSFRALLQPRRFSGLGVGFGLRGACLRGGLVGKCFTTLYVHRLLVDSLADLFRLNSSAMFASPAHSPGEDSDDQQCRNDGDDDPNNGAGSHVELLC
ncbi:hypothetical protein, partial [uncultured Mycobacterium sp.]|uniref:hypothetical protein n=1 Tax=uncultured Mycobacterium sp. TaxID=171292 RepID=UPI0035CB0437